MNGAAILEAPAPAFTPYDRAALASLVTMSKAGAPSAVEIGSGDGTGSTQVFLDYHCRRGGHLLCIDEWPSHVYDACRDNTARGGTFVQMARMPAKDAASRLPDDYFDVVYINALPGQRFRSVIDAIAIWRPKLKRGGGILAGRMADIARRTDSAVHPGIILAIEDAFGRGVELVTDAEITLDDKSKGRSSIWWVVAP